MGDDITYTVATGDSNGQIKVTPSSGSAYNVSVKGLGSAAYTNSGAYDAAGAASGVQGNLNSHTSNKSNPHGVTAAQVGALPTAGGTMTGPLLINGGEKDDGSGQLAMLKALSTNSAGAGTPWLGRAMVGAKNLTFLMGTYNGLAGLGAHSWTDASSGQGAAWAPIYIQPDGGANAALYIGQNGSGWTANSGTLVVKGSSTVNGGSVEVRGTLTATKINGLATVATSGNYNDLSNKPTIPAAYTHPSTHPASMITGGTFAGHVSVPASEGMINELPVVRNIGLLDGAMHSDPLPFLAMGYNNGDIALIYE